MSIYIAGALVLFILGLVTHSLYKNMKLYDKLDMK